MAELATSLSVGPPTHGTSDYMEMGKIHVKAWQQAYVGIIPAAFLDLLSIGSKQALFKSKLEAPPSHTSHEEFLVAKADDTRVVGWTGYGASRDDDADAATGELRGIYVDPSSWTQGVGRALVEKALQRMSHPLGYERVTLWVLTDNARARKFYDGLGFTHDGNDSSNVKKVKFADAEVEEMRYSVWIGKSGLE